MLSTIRWLTLLVDHRHGAARLVVLVLVCFRRVFREHLVQIHIERLLVFGEKRSGSVIRTPVRVHGLGDKNVLLSRQG